MKNPEDATPISNIRWHSQPITSIQFQPREECMLAVSSDDNKLSMWDFSVEPDENAPLNEEIPPQLMFLHQGQDVTGHIKELRFHPHYDSMILTTAEDSYNVFRPNFAPEEQPEESDEDDEIEREMAIAKTIQGIIDKRAEE